jgi:hypothetical protein
MSGKAPKHPRDANQLAKSVVDIAIGESASLSINESKDPDAVALGRRGGLKGGRARAQKLTKEQRSEIARKAAAARWGRDDSGNSNSK